MARTDDDRRRVSRATVRQSAMLRGIGGERAAMIVQVHDVSDMGVGFAAAEPLEIGAVYRLDICNHPRKACRAEIRSCQMLPDGHFHIGAQFC